MKRADDVNVQGGSWRAGRAATLKIGLAVIWMAAPRVAWGQWNGTNPVWTNSSVGIGTAAPAGALDILAPAGNALIVRGNAPSDAWAALFVSQTNAGFGVYDTAAKSYFAGNVGIGTAAPQYRLAVNGTIGAKDVMVTNTGWPDYVFRPGYRLRPLSEVAGYIQAHHRLPDIPSEAEVKERGVSVSEMQARLLAKIEELTLHLIQQDRENRELRGRVAQLENRAAGR